MMTFREVQVVVAILQIVIAATTVITVAWAVSLLLPSRRPLIRERLWMSALVGVLLSPVVPFLSDLVPFQVATLSLLPSDQEVRLQENSYGAVPVESVDSLRQSPVEMDEASAFRIAAAGQHRIDAELSVSKAEPRLSSPPSGAAISRARQTSSSPRRSLLSPVLWTVGLIWLAGIVVLSIRIVRGLWICRRMLSRAAPFDWQSHASALEQVRQLLGSRSSLRIVMSSEVAGPVVMGLSQPCIVLPIDSADWLSERQLVQVLLHEGAHIQRRDSLINLLQNTVRIIAWPHPLIHLMNDRLTQAREDVCDNWVLSHCLAADYCETLLQMTERCRCGMVVAGGLAMLPQGSLEKRITGLLDPQRDLARQWPRSRRWILQTALLLVPLLLGLIRFTPRVAQSAEPQPATRANASVESAVPQGTQKLTGQVVRGAAEDPVAGAEVILQLPLPSQTNDYVWPLPVRRTVTDAHGNYTFEGLAPGQYRIWSNHAGQTSRSRSLRGMKVALAESGKTDPVKLQLHPAASVKVRVTNHQTGQPVPNAVVHVGQDNLQHCNFATDTNGQVTVDSLGAGRWDISAVATDRARLWKSIDINAGTAADLEFDLEPGKELEGTVRDPQGKAVADVSIGIGQQGEMRVSSFGRTDSAGRYRVTGVPLDVPIVVLLSRADYVSQGGVQTRVTQAKSSQDFTIQPREPGVTVAGKVVDEAGQPIAGALLQNRGINYDGSEDEEIPNELREMTTGADGAFRLENLYRWGASNPTLEVRAPKFVTQRVEVHLDVPDQLTKLEIKLVPGHRLVGRVTNENGQPLQNVTIMATPASDGVLQQIGRTDKAGRFEADTLPPNARLRFMAQGYERLEKADTPLDTPNEQTFVMLRNGSFIGRVLDSKTGKPLTAFRVGWSVERDNRDAVRLRRSLENRGERSIRSQDGQFTLDNLEVGPAYRLTVDSDGYTRQIWASVNAVRGTNPQAVEIKLDAIDPANLANYNVRLLDADKKPVKGAQLRLIVALSREAKPGHTAFPYPWWTIQLGQLPTLESDNIVRFDKGITDSEGRYVFKAVPLKLETELVWWGEDVIPGRIDHFDQRLPQNADQPIEIVLPKAGRITGRINRKVFPEAVSIRIHREDGVDAQRRLTQLQPDQTTFEIGALGAGKYVVAIEANRGAARGAEGPVTPITSKNITVKEGDVREVNFDER